ncbi:undecaprenyl pyrophosphate synthase [Spiroplasma clarkii]|uniref:Isoprenyl transferase n=1 Tax=Spiroplasma clarkii TaxID=2139 RepID=A0A1Y0L0D6_9MOLU|nr:polyprenyl diphosphate synthase [Spiroplasma clarkii]ARU91443.1 undecaprenyl pyrophosphate synthase [Spiroplasma clarkii]ATX70862.1 undecaprenyl pyrophosphate synthase [Spiroplasma clarkii]
MKQLNHLGIILDGNGRWAQKLNKDRTFGHKQGMNKIFDTIKWCQAENIAYVTLFCFSTENWNRPVKEVDYLMKFPGQIFSDKELKKYIANGIRIIWVGRRTKVPKKTRQALENAESKTEQQTKTIVNLALDYGSGEELVSAVTKICQGILQQKFELNDINQDLIYNNLYTCASPPIDFLIRTGGEQRLSNFMLLQLGYAELYFTKIYWPDFDAIALKTAIADYYARDRRFGRIEV